jgi:hypothetical protein
VKAKEVPAIFKISDAQSFLKKMSGGLDGADLRPELALCLSRLSKTV